MRSWLEKLFMVLPLLALACLLAALYGALHNQLSYTLSAEYFDAVKFPAYHIPLEQHNRVGAAIAGLQTGWRMGFLIGLPIALFGILQRDWRHMLRQTWQSYLLVIGFTTFFAALGLAAGWIMVPANGLVTVHYPRGILDPQAFSRAGFLHDASHLGGFMGIVLGSLYQFYQALRDYYLPANQVYKGAERPAPITGPSPSAVDVTGSKPIPSPTPTTPPAPASALAATAPPAPDRPGDAAKKSPPKT